MLLTKKRVVGFLVPNFEYRRQEVKESLVRQRENLNVVQGRMEAELREVIA